MKSAQAIRRSIRKTLYAVVFCTLAVTSQARAINPRVQHSAAQRNIPDVLVVRARAGLHPRMRHHMFAQQDAQEVTRIDALNTSIIRVPHGRLAATQRQLRRSGYFLSVERDAIASAAQLPDDPDLSQEWGLTKIDAPMAWDVTMGSSDITVAVVDSGVDSTHVDLHNQLIPGYDFVNGDADPSDDNGHGTRMAGVIAAEADNGAGIAGVAPHAKLLPIKVLGSDGTGAYSNIANGITYAADHGARVINLSLAGTVASDVMQSAVDYAVARGAVVVAASGNFGTSQPTYPAACSSVVAVGATDQNDTVASFSNSGSWLTLAAPGVSIMTTNWTGAGGAPYIGSSGTSPAAAFVSGAFALLFAAHPELSSPAAVNVMTQAAQDIGTAGWDPYAGWGRIDVAAALGATQVPAPTPPPPTPTASQDHHVPKVAIFAPVPKSLVYGDVHVDVVASDDSGVATVELRVDNVVVSTASAPPFGFVWDTSTVSPGKHTLTARAYDAAGHRKKSRPVLVEVTNGVGLEVKHARLSSQRRTGGGTLTLTGKFALPDGGALDQVANTFSAALTSPTGVVIATAQQTSALIADAHGRLHLTAATDDGAGGKIKILVTRPKTQPAYNLTLTATGANVGNAGPTMNLVLTINGVTVSQSVAFRSRNTTYMFP